MSFNVDAQLVLKNGRPSSVLLSLKSFEKLLELAEDTEDLREIRHLARRKQSWTPIEHFTSSGG